MVYFRHSRCVAGSALLGAMWLACDNGLAQQQEGAAIPEVQGFVEQAPLRAEQSVSRSRQFIVEGGTPQTRGMMSFLAEQTKDSLLQLLDVKQDGWKIPVLIKLHGQPGDPSPARTVVPQLILTGDQQILRLDVHLSRGIERDVLERELMSMLLYEGCLRNHPFREGDDAPVIKPWVQEGLREAIAWKAGNSDRKLYEALFRHAGVMPYQTLLSMDMADWENSDAATRAAFRVASGALIMSLLDQPNGKEGMLGFLSEAPRYEGEMAALLRKYFPGLNLSENSLEKWWLLRVAQAKEVKLTETNTIARTEAELDDALRLHFHDKQGSAMVRPLKEFPFVADLSPAERQESVRPAQDGLVRVSYRCFPSYRPMLNRYQSVLQKIAQGKDLAKLPVELDELDAIRARMRQRATRTRDYLDWYVISRAEETSGAFDDYMRAREEVENQHTRRDDPVSRYLDGMQKVFHREQPKGQSR